jgi:adenosylcobinamide-phosphate synthase
MSAGAGALNLKLGGGSVYQGQWQDRSLLGPSTGNDPTATAVDACCLLVNRVLLLWVFVLMSFVLIF